MKCDKFVAQGIAIFCYIIKDPTKSSQIVEKIAQFGHPVGVGGRAHLRLTQKNFSPNWRGSLSTVDLHVLSSSDQLLSILLTLFAFLHKSYLNEEVNRTEPEQGSLTEGEASVQLTSLY